LEPTQAKADVVTRVFTRLYPGSSNGGTWLAVAKALDEGLDTDEGIRDRVNRLVKAETARTHKGRRKTVSLQSVDEATLDKALARDRTRNTFADFLEGLPAVERRALVLVYRDGRSRTESATALGVTRHRLEFLLSQGVNKIRRELEK
jgi:DNA-directed RNA polymerase specialized sigma24 family protein